MRDIFDEVKCDFCGKMNKKKKRTVKELRCNFCGRVNKRKKRVVEGLKCNLCGKVCPDRKTMKIHLKEKHELRPQKKVGSVLHDYYKKIVNGEVEENE